MTTMTGTFKHGANGYRFHKCRCPECVAGNAVFNEARRKNRELSFKIDPEPLIAFLLSVATREQRPIYQAFSRWREAGGVDIFVADKHCVRNGVHPWEVYGDDWWEFGMATER